jgi:hypothetical protein
VSGATGAFLVSGAAPLKRQQRTPEPLLKRVGVDGIGEAKSYEEIFVLLRPRPRPGWMPCSRWKASMASLADPKPPGVKGNSTK